MFLIMQRTNDKIDENALEIRQMFHFGCTCKKPGVASGHDFGYVIESLTSSLPSTLIGGTSLQNKQNLRTCSRLDLDIFF